MRKLFFLSMLTAVVLMFSSFAFGATNDSTTVTGVDTITPTGSYASTGVYGYCVSMSVNDGSGCSAQYPAQCNDFTKKCSCAAGFTAVSTGEEVWLTHNSNGWVHCRNSEINPAGCLRYSPTVCYKN